MFVIEAPFYAAAKAVAYASVALAEASVIPLVATSITVGGYSTAGDAPAVEYKRVASEPSHAGKFQDLRGAWFELVSTAVAAENFGAVGDNVANDYQPWQDAINYAEVKGAKIYGWGLRSYRLESAPIIKTGVAIDFQGATWNCYLTGTGGADYGPRGMTNCSLRNGSIYVFSSGTVGSQAIWHSAFSLGNAYGEQSTDINNPNDYDEIYGVVVDNMTFSTNSDGKSAVQCIGLIHDCSFTNCRVPDSDKIFVAFGYDWGIIGSSVAGVGIASDPTQMNASKTYYQAGSGTTRHGYNIVVENWTIGNLTRTVSVDPNAEPNARAVRFSGGYGYTVNNIKVASCTGVPFIHHAGDLGMEFAPSNIKPYACKDFTWTNLQCDNTKTAAVFSCDTNADNITRAMLPGPDGCNYVPMEEPVQTTNCVWDGVTGTSTDAASDRGVIFMFVRGGTYRGLVLSGYNNGIDVQEEAFDILLEKPTCYDNRGAGITISQNPRTEPRKIRILQPYCYRNGQNSGLAIKFRAGIYVDKATSVIIDNGSFGNVNIAADTAETQVYGVFIDDNARRVSLTNNHCYKTNSGVAFGIGTSATSYGLLDTFENNTCESGITLLNGVNILPVQKYATPTTGTIVREYTCDKATCNTGDTPPAGFVSNTGDRIIYRDPDAASNYGLFCFVGGTAGTDAVWKKLNAIGG